MLFYDPPDIKIRKIIVNTFVREVVLYPDKIIITCNFSDTHTPQKIASETINIRASANAYTEALFIDFFIRQN